MPRHPLLQICSEIRERAPLDQSLIQFFHQATAFDKNKGIFRREPFGALWQGFGAFGIEVLVDCACRLMRLGLPDEAAGLLVTYLFLNEGLPPDTSWLLRLALRQASRVEASKLIARSLLDLAIGNHRFFADSAAHAAMAILKDSFEQGDNEYAIESAERLVAAALGYVTSTTYIWLAVHWVQMLLSADGDDRLDDAATLLEDLICDMNLYPTERGLRAKSNDDNSAGWPIGLLALTYGRVLGRSGKMPKAVEWLSNALPFLARKFLTLPIQLSSYENVARLNLYWWGTPTSKLPFPSAFISGQAPQWIDAAQHLLRCGRHDLCESALDLLRDFEFRAFTQTNDVRMSDSASSPCLPPSTKLDGPTPTLKTSIDPRRDATALVSLRSEWLHPSHRRLLAFLQDNVTADIMVTSVEAWWKQIDLSASCAQTALRPKRCLISLNEIGDSLVISLRMNDCSEFRELSAGSLQKLRQLALAIEEDHYAGVVSRLKADLAECARILGLDDLIATIARHNRAQEWDLIFLADGRLSDLPLNLLIVGSQQLTLCEVFNSVSLAGSVFGGRGINSWRRTEADNTVRRAFVFFEPYLSEPSLHLPATARESTEVCNALEAGGYQITRYDSTSNSHMAACRELADAKYAHFACHGVFDEIAPLSSGLLLNRDVLTAQDLLMEAAIPLNAEVVMLGACSVGRRSDHGFQRNGMVEAFLARGAQRIIAARWPVRDSQSRVFGTMVARVVAEIPELDSEQMWNGVYSRTFKLLAKRLGRNRALSCCLPFTVRMRIGVS